MTKGDKKMINAELINKAKNAFSLEDEEAFDQAIVDGWSLEDALQMFTKDYHAGNDITKWVKENQGDKKMVELGISDFLSEVKVYTFNDLTEEDLDNVKKLQEQGVDVEVNKAGK